MKLLVVEDEPKIANALKRGLSAEGYIVDIALDGASGEARVLGVDYDLIILDRMLPEISDGLEICRALRAEGKTTPVLILTAKEKVPDRVLGLDTGADDYLVKPFAFEELLARVRALLRRPDDAIGPILRHGPLALDPKTHEVTRAGQRVALSKREYALCEYFLRHPDRILTKDQLINHVWDDQAEILPNTVEAYIGYLRRKLGRDSIETIRGFGYRLGWAAPVVDHSTPSLGSRGSVES